MKKNLGLGMLLGILTVNGYAQQEEGQNQAPEQLKEVVVSDSKFDLNSKTSGKVITKITSEVLEKSIGMSVSEVLTKFSGIQINESTGQSGSNLGVSVRGGRNRQVLVRIDGVTVSDPSAGSGEFDFRLLNLEQIESIEILKGGSSVLFGSGAASAVVNIKLKRTVNKPIAANFNFTFGTNKNAENQDYYGLADSNVSGGLRGSVGKIDYIFNANHQVTIGLSAAESADVNEELENDSFKKNGLYAKVGYQFNDDLKWSIYGNYDELNIDFDSGAFTDGDNLIYSKQRRVGNEFKYTFIEGIKLTYTDAFSWTNRSVASSFPAEFESFNYTFDAFATKKFGEGLNVAAGANGTYSKLSVSRISFGEAFLSEQLNDRDANFDIIDPYANVVYNSDFGLNLNLGGRLNIHSDYGTHLVYSANPSYNIDLSNNSFVQVLGSYSTSYITPSLSQLFDNSFGSANLDLEPEENATVEGGFKYERDSSKIKLSAIYFHRDHKNSIGFDSNTFQNINVEEDFETQGVEVDFSGRFLKNNALIATINYTYTDVSDLPNNIRIAKDVINASIGYDITKSTNVLASYQYRSRRGDSDFRSFPSEAVTLKEYTLLDFQVNQNITENFNVFARVTNILNENYQEVLGFETKGRNIKVGLNFNF